LLRSEGISTTLAFAQNPVIDEGSNQKDPAIVILASAALVISLTPILSRVLASLSRKPVLIKDKALVPVEDSSGNILTNAKGEPILRLEDRSRYVEATSEKDLGKLEIKGFGISISFDSSPKGE
jgi:hypothetical protein